MYYVCYCILVVAASEFFCKQLIPKMEFSKYIYVLLLLEGFVKSSTQNCQTNDYGYETQLKCEYNDYDENVCNNVTVVTYSITCESIEDGLASTAQSNAKIKMITINKSDFKTIVMEGFKSYSNLKSLKIETSNIQEIQPGGFNGLINLENLEITNHFITKLSKGVFNSLTSLKELNLSHNNINTIAENAFLGLENLQILSLSNNAISDITERRSVHENLKILNLSNNNITNLISFKDFPFLHTLILNNNLIEQLSDDLFADTIIKSLDLSSNRIERIDGNVFVGLTKLEDLNIASNELFNIQNSKLPVGLFSGNKLLKYLNVSRTRLGTIPVGSFTGLKYLLSLDLSCNNITYLPRGIFHDLRDLNELYINNNFFSYFNYDGFGKLHKINLNDNLWNCDILSNVTKQLTGTQIVRGTIYNTTNVFGIDCVESTSDNKVADVAGHGIQQSTSEEDREITLNATIEECRNFFAGLRSDLRIFQEEFSEKFLDIFKATCLASIDNSKPSVYDEESEVNLKLIRLTLHKLETIRKFADSQKLKSESYSSHAYSDFSTNAILVYILIVLVLILVSLILAMLWSKGKC